MSLCELPDEILGLISFWLNGFDLCRLWIASDLQFRYRLCTRVITELDIHYTNPESVIWPGNFLNKLERLSRLSLVVDEMIDHIPIKDVIFSPIPSLKSLKLVCANIDQILEIECESRFATSESDQPLYIDLNHLFCNLEYLELNTTDSQSQFFVELFQILPKKLKTFLLPNGMLVPHESEDHPYDHNQNEDYDENQQVEALFQLLPRTLTELVCYFDDVYFPAVFLDFSLLPPNLTSIETNAQLDFHSYHMIPQRLKSLQLYGKEYDIDRLSPFLPSGLSTLLIDIEQPNTRLFTQLDRLESLTLNTYFEPADWPNCLPTFKGSTLRLPDIPISCIGNRITTLDLYRFHNFSREFFEALPQTLTSLTICRRTSSAPFAFFDLLPRKMTTLSINAMQLTEQISHLPDSLTQLSLIFTQKCRDSYFDRLPQKLEILSLNGDVPVAVLSMLPPTLKCLRLTSNFALDDQSLAVLPRGLKSLYSSCASLISDAGVGNLPQNLEILHLYDDKHMKDAAMANLPRSLHVLNLQNKNFTDACIKHLPPKLVFLNLESSMNMTLNCMKDLPKYLRSLYLPRCPNSLLKIDDMPQYLKDLFIGNMQHHTRYYKK